MKHCTLYSVQYKEQYVNCSSSLIGCHCVSNVSCKKFPQLIFRKNSTGCTASLTFGSALEQSTNIFVKADDTIFIGPRYPWSDLWVPVSLTERGCADLTHVTLADEDTKSIPTDNANRAIQCNVATQVMQL